MRFIELNPLCTGLIDHPGNYFWLSYLANAEGIEQGLIITHNLYRHLGRSDSERQDANRQLFWIPWSKADDRCHPRCDQQGIGNGRFKAKIETLTGRRSAPFPRGRLRLLDVVQK